MVRLEPTLTRGIFTFLYFDYNERLIESLILIPVKKKKVKEKDNKILASRF